MFLAIDIGNTHTVFGVYKKRKLLVDWRLTSKPKWMKDEIGAQVKSFLTKAGIITKKIDDIGISSVVPNLTDIYITMARKYFHKEPLIVNASLNLGITIHYDNPISIGADRICNAIAGHAKYGGPLIIIDFGTATTYDVVASDGDYLGGVIAPGVETSAAALHRRTAKLPKLTGIALNLPKIVISTNTVNSMQAGILCGSIDSMTGMVNRIQEELFQRESKKAIVIATGGFSKFAAEYSQVIQHVEPFLVLDGIRLIYERVRSIE